MNYIKFLSFQICAGFAATIPIMACVSILFIVPESPIWLVEKGLYDMADRAIDTLGRDQLEFAEEVQFMKTIDRVNECLKI